MGPGQGRAGRTEGPGREGGDSGPRWGRFQALLPSTPAPGAGGPEPVRAWWGGIPERWVGVSVTTCGEAASLPGPPPPTPTPTPRILLFSPQQAGRLLGLRHSPHCPCCPGHPPPVASSLPKAAGSRGSLSGVPQTGAQCCLSPRCTPSSPKNPSACKSPVLSSPGCTRPEIQGSARGLPKMQG